MRRGGWAFVLALTACAVSLRPAARPEVEATPEPAFAGSDARGRGGPHLSEIVQLSLLTDRSVVTRDEQGIIKLWPTLDGSREPIPLGDRAQHVDAAPRTGGWLAASVRGLGVELFYVRDRAHDVGDLRQLVTRDYVFFSGPNAVDLAVFNRGVLVLDEEGGLQVINDGEEAVPIQSEYEFDEVVRIPSGTIFGLAMARHSMGMDLEVVELTPGEAPDEWEEVLAFELYHLPHGFSGDQLAFDENGEQVAVIETRRSRVSVMRREDDTQRQIPFEMRPMYTWPRIGFVDATHLMVTHDEATGEPSSHLLDLETGALYPRVTPVVNKADPSVPVAAAHAHDLRILAAGESLSIDHPLEPTDPERGYLGYRSFVPVDVALSPSESRIAYATEDGIEIEGPDGSIEWSTTLDWGVSFVRFLDDWHLIIGTSGSLEVWDTRRGEVVAAAVLHGLAYDLRAFESDGVRARLALSLGDGQTGYAVLERGNAGWGDPVVSVIPTAAPSGVGLSESGLWTYRAPWVRSYPESAMETGIAAHQSGAAVELEDAPLVRRDTLQISVVNRTILRRTVGDAQAEWASEVGPISRIHEGPSHGSRDYFELTRGDLSLVALDRERWTVQWRAAWGTAPTRFVAAGEELLVIADGTGAAVVDATDGQLERRRCGGEFGLYLNRPISLPAAQTGLCTEY